MMAPRARRLLVTTSMLALSGAAAVTGPACYGPTEVRIDVTTNVACDAGLSRGAAAGIETSLFTGTRADAFFGIDPTAETRECAASGEPRIGSLAVVPSGDRDGRFDLEVIAGIGVAASSCRANGFKNCIVSRRRVTFRPHQSLHVPVLLSDRCIDKPCGTDESCDLGECAKLLDCNESGCPRERGEPPAAALPDAEVSADASVDAPTTDAEPLEAAVPTACGPTPDVVVSGQAVVGPLAIEGNDFVYANGTTPASMEIRRVSRRGGPHAVEHAIPGLLAVAAGGSAIAWTRATIDGAEYVRQPNGAGVGVTTGTRPQRTNTIALAGAGIVGMASVSGTSWNAFAVVGGAYVGEAGAFPGQRSNEVVVDEDGDWFTVVGGSIIHYAFDGTRSTLGDYITTGVPKADIAVADRTVYIALADATRAGIHRIPRAQITPSYAGTALVPDVLPDSIATDGVGLYYLVGSTLFRRGLLAGDPVASVSLGDLGVGVDRLVVDAECVYGVDQGGARIVRRAK